MKSEELKDRIRRALSEVKDPETGLDVMRMDIIHDLETDEEGKVELVFRPSSPFCPMAYVLADSIKQSIEAVDDVKSVTIKVRNFNKAQHLEEVLNTPRRSGK